MTEGSHRITVFLLVITLALVSGCSSSDASPETCEPDHLAGTGDVEAPGDGIEVWGLIFATYRGLAPGEPVFALQGEEVKIVWRATGEGEIAFRAVGPDGSVVTPVWGPIGHASSTWDIHPGEEWGTGWVFPKIGCWSIEIQRGDDVAYLDVDIRA